MEPRPDPSPPSAATPDAGTRDVFISHASVDAPTAERLCAGLEGLGLSCWLAQRDVPSGELYPGEIVRAIKRSRVVLLLFSDHTSASRHVTREVTIASEEKKIVIPVRLDRVDPSGDLQYWISGAQWVDAAEGSIERNTERVAAAIKARLRGAGVAVDLAPATARKAGRRAGMAAAASGLALLLLLAGGAWLALSRCWVASWCADPPAAEFSVANETGRAVQTIYVSAPGGPILGPDLLGAGNLSDQATRSWRRPNPGSCIYDVRAFVQIETETVAHVLEGVDLCRSARVVLSATTVSPRPNQIAIYNNGSSPLRALFLVSKTDARPQNLLAGEIPPQTGAVLAVDRRGNCERELRAEFAEETFTPATIDACRRAHLWLNPPLRVSFVNHTGEVVRELYVWPASQSGYGQDWLGRGLLAINAIMPIDVPRNQCRQNVRSVQANNQVWERRDVDVCANHTVQLGRE